MSKHDKIAKLKEYIKNFVIKELEKDEEIEEASTTASAGAYHYDTPYAFYGGRKKDKEKKKKISHAGGYKPVNEGYGEMMDELEKIYRPSGAPPIAKEALKDLADEYDIGRVLYAARTNEKSFREVMDMKIDQLQSQYVNKKHINTIKRGKKLREVTKQEVNALRNLVKGIGNLKKDFSKATKVGDKELMKKDYNKHYETLLKAEKAMVQLMQFFKTKQMLGEGRYHNWRNDESLTPKQKIGRSIREVRNSLNELNKTINMNLKLKTELQVDSRDYWKTTHKALSNISEKLVKLAGKVGNLK